MKVHRTGSDESGLIEEEAVRDLKGVFKVNSKIQNWIQMQTGRQCDCHNTG